MRFRVDLVRQYHKIPFSSRSFKSTPVQYAQLFTLCVFLYFFHWSFHSSNSHQLFIFGFVIFPVAYFSVSPMFLSCSWLYPDSQHQHKFTYVQLLQTRKCLTNHELMINVLVSIMTLNNRTSASTRAFSWDKCLGYKSLRSIRSPYKLEDPHNICFIFLCLFCNTILIEILCFPADP